MKVRIAYAIFFLAVFALFVAAAMARTGGNTVAAIESNCRVVVLDRTAIQPIMPNLALLFEGITERELRDCNSFRGTALFAVIHGTPEPDVVIILFRTDASGIGMIGLPSTYREGFISIGDCVQKGAAVEPIVYGAAWKGSLPDRVVLRDIEFKVTPEQREHCARQAPGR